MMTATTYPATMTDLRGESSHSNLWSTYNGSAHLSNKLGTAAMDSGYHHSASPSTLAGRPRSGHEQAYSYGRYAQEDSALYDRHPQPNLSAQSTTTAAAAAAAATYPNLKRSFSQTEPAAYQEIVQDLRDDGSQLTVNHDHKLLSFRQTQDKHTIVDQQGQMQQLELSAQLHGMFFLSEMPSTTGGVGGGGGVGPSLQPELTCYRRNLFQISGSLITPRSQLSVVNENNESVLVSSMEVAISAIESVDGNSVRLIVIPWKTPPPNAPDISQNPDQEPAALPLIPFQDYGTEPEGDYAVYPIGWRRLQFRIATANNGRRKELQQHFVLHLKVYATLADNSKVVLTESTTAPIVVRGRSPRNFQARKEIPLLGSSAGSRGQALVETGMGVVAGTLSVKPQEFKRSVMDLHVPRSSFTFSPPKLTGRELSSMRPSAYSAWNTSGNASMSQGSSSNSLGSYPAITTTTTTTTTTTAAAAAAAATTAGTDSYPKVSTSGTSNFSSETPPELPLQTTIPPMSLSLGGANEQQTSAAHGRQQQQYTYAQSASGSQLPSSSTSAVRNGQENALSVPRYFDGYRPSKSPRHAGQHSIHNANSITRNNSESPEYRYGSSAPGSGSAPSREYYPSSSSNTWATTTTTTTTAASKNNSSSAAAAYVNTTADPRPYSFSHEPYKSGSTAQLPSKSETRGSYEQMNNYSWTAN